MRRARDGCATYPRSTPKRGLARRHTSLELELQLGAHIVGTAISPGWEQIAALGAIAVIRTGLSFFLSREMDEEAVLLRAEQAQSLATTACDTPSPS